MFEEVCFKASFDNREGRAVTETKGREFQTWTAGKQKARPPCCFLLKKGMWKVLSSEDVIDTDVFLLLLSMSCYV